MPTPGLRILYCLLCLYPIIGCTPVPTPLPFQTPHTLRGDVGLVTVPTARLSARPGPRLSFSITRDTPALSAHTTIGQRLETGLHQSNTDPAETDLRVVTVPEAAWTPQIAVGWRDLGAPDTTTFYSVASKRWFDWDGSIGLVRSRWPASADLHPFTGVSWQSPIEDLSLQAELTGQISGDKKQPMSFGLGLSWQPSLVDNIVSIGLRSTTSTPLTVAATLDLGAALAPKRSRSSSMPELPRFGSMPSSSIVAALYDDGVLVDDIRLEDRSITAWIRDRHGRTLTEIIGRTALTLASMTDDAVHEVIIVPGRRGYRGSAIHLMRNDVIAAGTGQGSAEEVWRDARIEPAPSPVVSATGTTEVDGTLSTTIDPFATPMQHRTALRIGTHTDLGHGLEIGGTSRLALRSDGLPLNDVTGTGGRQDTILYDAQRLYAETSYIAWRHSPVQGLHLGAVGGLLEEQVAGAAADIIYRPDWATWSIGAGTTGYVPRSPDPPSLPVNRPLVVDPHIRFLLERPNERTTYRVRIGRDLAGTPGLSIDSIVRPPHERWSLTAGAWLPLGSKTRNDGVDLRLSFTWMIGSLDHRRLPRLLPARVNALSTVTLRPIATVDGSIVSLPVDFDADSREAWLPAVLPHPQTMFSDAP